MADDPKVPEAPQPTPAPSPAAKPPAPAPRAAAPGGEAHAKAAPATGPPDPPPPAGVAPPAFIASLQTAMPDGVAALSYYLGDWTVIVPVAHILEVARYLRDAPGARFDY